VLFVGVFSVSAALFLHREEHGPPCHRSPCHPSPSTPSTAWQAGSVKVLRSTFSKLDLLSSARPYLPRTSPLCSPALSAPSATNRFFFRRPRAHVDLTRRHVDSRAGQCAPPTHVSAEAAVCRTFCYFSVFFLVFMLFVLGYCLLILQCYVSLVETFVTGFVVPLFSTVPKSDSNSAFTASASLRLLLFSSGGSDRFALICSPFASVTAICGQIEKAGTLVCPIPYCLFVILHCCFRFGSIVGEPTPFSVFCFFFGSPTLSSFRIKSGKDPPCNMLNSLETAT
jgi:hypothetical protein